MHYLDPKFLIETAGVLGVIIIIFAESGLFFGFFLPGDSLLFTAGLLASQGILDPYTLTVGCTIGAILGDTIGYTFGKRVGPKIFIKENSFIWNKKHIDRSRDFFIKYGKRAIILARFTPIVRTFTPILAGIGKMEYKYFLIYNVTGALIWVFGMIVGGYWFGRFIPNPDRYLIPVIIIIILVSVVPQLKTITKAKYEKSN